VAFAIASSRRLRSSEPNDPRGKPVGFKSLIAAIKDMELLRKGSRLSVQPIRKAEFGAILKLGQ
jgi:predicted RNA-binding protein with PUA-like domain